MAIKPVIAGTNGSVGSARAVAWAVQEAVQRDVPLRIVAVLPLGRLGGWMDPADPLYGALREAVVQALEEAASRASLTAPGLTVDTSLVIDEPAPVLAELGLSAAMLVVGARGTSDRCTGSLGSVSRYLATHARCPVVIVPRYAPVAHHHQVAVGVRDADDGEAPVAFALEEAAGRRSHLAVVQAWQWIRPAGAHHAVAPAHISSGALTRLSRLLAPWKEKYPHVEVGEEVIHGRPVPTLIRLSGAADLLVLGRRHRSLASTDARLGSVTEAVLTNANGPVAIVPAE
jgi:nucleotide-binding universal stress UspA family protein